MARIPFTMSGQPTGVTIFTVGHSTRSVQELIKLLKSHGVTKLVDVRTVPRSRHTPQFNRDTLPEALKEAGIEYEHMAGLGGFRHTRPDSPNTGWRNSSFRGYADYMLTPGFEENLSALVEAAKQRQIAIMCAESVTWRCHRSLIADALVVRGVRVKHIMSLARTDPHELTPWAKVEGARVTYPAPDEQPSLPGERSPTKE